MNRIVTSMVITAILLAGSAVVAEEPVLDTDEKKTLYTLGLAIARNLGAFDLSAEELELVKAGLIDGVLGNDPKVDPAVFGPKIDQLVKDRAAAKADKAKAAGAEFVEKMAKEPGAVKTDSGMVYFELTAGSGESPAGTDKVKVHYHGTLPNGNVFDSSVDRGEPTVFPLDGVIKCFSEGIQKMKVGGKSKLVCPPDIAYGDRGAGPDIGPGATLVFEVELIEIVKETPAAEE